MLPTICCCTKIKGTPIWCVITAIFFHRNFADQNMMIHFLKNMMIAGGLLQIVHFGAGPVIVDARAGR
jgi:putative oxidoreductase